MKIVFSIIFLLLLKTSIYSQFFYPRDNEGLLQGGLGMSWIDGEPHYSIMARPEFSFGNYGFGIDLNLEFDKDGKLRKENFNETSDYLSLIRYIRYGYKGDPFYIRIGAMDYATLGHGSIMYLYNNSISYDSRKIGMELDIDFNTFGFESVYGNFGEAGVAGLRGFVRPLQYTDLKSVPVIGRVEIGATYSLDFHKNAGIIQGVIDSANNQFNPTEDKGSINIYGFDIGLPLFEFIFLGAELYLDYAKIVDYGSGIGAGIILNSNALDLIQIKARLERRFNKGKYIPSYFNSFYELERFSYDQDSKSLNGKRRQLESIATDLGNGFYGQIIIDVLNTFDVIGSYQRLDKDPKSGILHMETNISPRTAAYVLRAGYDKIRIENEKDLFKLDDRSFLFVELGYKPVEYLLLSIVYNWTFLPIRDSNDNILKYEPQKRIEPRISFIYPFDIGD